MTKAKESLWAEYREVCEASKMTGRYDRVEPLAWRRLQQELRKLHGKEKQGHDPKQLPVG
jgi:hypothetical protein